MASNASTRFSSRATTRKSPSSIRRCFSSASPIRERMRAISGSVREALSARFIGSTCDLAELLVWVVGAAVVINVAIRLVS